MAHEVQGVVSLAKDAPVQLTTILVPDPGPGEALVEVQACGVCHTDLHYKLGGIGDDYPYLLGHEAAGVVSRRSAPASPRSQPGDYVILNWRAVCGHVPGLPARATLVLLRHPQRAAEDDAGGRHAAVPRAGHRRVRREDPGRRRPVHQGESAGSRPRSPVCSAAG